MLIGGGGSFLFSAFLADTRLGLGDWLFFAISVQMARKKVGWNCGLCFSLLALAGDGVVRVLCEKLKG